MYEWVFLSTAFENRGQVSLTEMISPTQLRFSRRFKFKLLAGFLLWKLVWFAHIDTG